MGDDCAGRFKIILGVPCPKLPEKKELPRKRSSEKAWQKEEAELGEGGEGGVVKPKARNTMS